MMVSRRSVALWGVVVALAASASLADTDIVRQLHYIGGLDAPAKPLDAVQKLLADRFKLSDTPWASLDARKQRAMLWDAGLIRASLSPSSSSSSSSGAVVGEEAQTYHQVYVPCGNTMNDVFIPYTTMVQQTTAMNCTLGSCNKNTHFTGAACLADALVNVTTCGVDYRALTSLAAYNHTSWAQDGEIGSTFDPVIVRKQARGRNASDPRKRVIPIDMFAILEHPDLVLDTDVCPSKTSFVIPCQAINMSDATAKRDWCPPSQQLGLTLWLTPSTPAPTPTSNDSPSESSSWALNSLAVTFLVALAIAVVTGVVLFVTMRKKHGSDYDTPAHPSGPAAHNGSGPRQRDTYSDDRFSGTTSGSSGREIELANETYRKSSAVLAEFCADQALMMKRIAFSRVRLQKPLDKGANGEVWRAQHDGQLVAVKRVRLHESNSAEIEIKTLEEFTREIRLASTLDHPNIVGFIGLSWRVLSELCMVSEFMPLGDLARHLDTNEGRQMKWGDEKVRIAVDVANALVYLHSLLPQVIHRDLKSRNVLLDEQLTAKLSDFGLSRERSPEETMTSGVGTMLWTAPEVLRGERYDEKADIYSFGVLLVELDTRLPPFSLNTELGKIRSKAMALLPLITRGTIRPKFSPHCPAPVLKLATECFNLDPAIRPTAMEVVYHLRSKIRPLL